jgi:integrase
MTVKAWSEIWLNTYKRPALNNHTYYDYELRLKNFVLPSIGHMPLKDVKPNHLQDILSGMDGFSKDRIVKVRNTLTQMFERAVDDDNLIKSPARNLVIPNTAVNGKRRSITAYERAIITQTAETHPAGAWILTMLYCGLRPQETAALQGRHINTKTMEITIEQALKSDGTIGTTKTGAGKRIVPIDPELLSYLPETKAFDFVFRSAKGLPLNNLSMQKLWRSFKRQMNINAGCKVYRNQLIPPYPIADDLTAYHLRHTFCTDMQDAGVDINVAKDLMGHANISVTANIYTHLTDDKRKQAAEKMATFHAARS